MKPHTLLLSLPGGYPGLPNMGLEIVYEDIVNADLPCTMFRSDLLMCEHVKPSLLSKIAAHDAVNFFLSDRVFNDEIQKDRLKRFLCAYGISCREQKAYRKALDLTIEAFERSVISSNPSILAISLNSDKLIAALFFIRKAREISPTIFTVLGGTCADDRMGESIMNCFRDVDCVIQGRGEFSLKKLIQCHNRRENYSDIPGLLQRRGSTLEAAGPHIIQKPYSQPLLNQHFEKLLLLEKKYDRNEFGLQHGIPVCAAIGCWWGNCDFCGRPKHEKMYAINKPRQVAQFICDTYSQYGFNDVYWLDQIQPPMTFLIKFRDHIKKLNMSVNIAGEYHAMNCSADHVRILSEAGWKEIQVGIESYSDNLLRRMGKGARLIHLLQFYLLCAKHGITIQGNLIQHHPKETPADIKRNLTIMQLTCHLVLPELQPYYVSEGSRLSESFDKKKHKLYPLGRYRVLYPKKLRSRLHFPYRYFPKRRTTTRIWNSIERLRKMLDKRDVELSYVDDGTRLMIRDSRFFQIKRLFLRGLEREIILKCTQVMSLKDIFVMFGAVPKKNVKRALSCLIKKKLLLVVEAKYINLVLKRET